MIRGSLNDQLNYLMCCYSLRPSIQFAVKPVAVHILTKEKFVSADKHYDVECKSSGSRPEAVITWWMGMRQIKRLAKSVRVLVSIRRSMCPIIPSSYSSISLSLKCVRLGRTNNRTTQLIGDFAALLVVPSQFTETGNQSLSVLTFTPSVEDDGQFLTCRSENPFIPHSSIEDKWRLVVHCEYRVE